MRAIVQRVSEASVTIAGETTAAIGRGMVVFLGIAAADGDRDVIWTAEKITQLRIFPDDQDKMNLSLADIGGEMLIVSQFTLHGDCRKGRRPGFSTAAPPAVAEPLYLNFVEEVRRRNIATATGTFQASMAVRLINDGPVTMMLDSTKLF
jgi:D-tyrosyl-tRNA(Tyr) deacylase